MRAALFIAMPFCQRRLSVDQRKLEQVALESELFRQLDQISRVAGKWTIHLGLSLTKAPAATISATQALSFAWRTWSGAAIAVLAFTSFSTRKVGAGGTASAGSPSSASSHETRRAAPRASCPLRGEPSEAKVFGVGSLDSRHSAIGRFDVRLTGLRLRLES
jgi:hypothetical protein